MKPALAHLLIVPIVLPLLAAALMLLFDSRRSKFNSFVNIGATFVGLLVALEILRRVDEADRPGAIGVYLTSNWEAPFGIVLVADRLSALMLALAGAVSLGSAVYASASWSRAGVYFHPLFQVLVMGLNGAFLTGDLFNLFVFFEVMLAASYGLQLHGSGWVRVHSGLHYIAVNLVASSLFLVGLGMIYGVMGSLSMADIAAKLPHVAEHDRGLLHASASILAVAFLVKAAIWPLNFWLVPAYAAASAPVAAIFALMTKVGIYTLLRLWTLLFSEDAGPSTHFGASAFVYGGLATIAFGVIGVIASLRLGRIAGFSVIVSSGTLLTAIGFDAVSVTSAALYYLVSATLAVSVLFLLVELVERRAADGPLPLHELDVLPGEDTNLDDDETPLVGRMIPIPVALLGLAFIACALLVAGLPPLSGFVAKVALLTALSRPDELGLASTPLLAAAVPWLFGALLVSGLAVTVSMSRAGVRHFWSGSERVPPRLRFSEGAPVLALLLACAWLTFRAENVMRYMRAASESLHSPAGYIDAVMSTKPVPGPTRPFADREGPP
ncbi:MAG: monovalent cation/H+ antiporter subunit D [Labilithrix sp.]|nr:monovalent cation/H+ antiporter subunit D [Labilithrix sp.]MCW5811515.1 monovalent cation/H+ antiporter subunit D [Labilithrix sp.]